MGRRVHNRHKRPMSAILKVCKMLCFAGPIGLYLHQLGNPQLNENARSRWRLLQCAMDSKYPETAGAELIDSMTLRAAAVANLRSNQDSIKLPSEEKESN
jgi:hypothetical protein